MADFPQSGERKQENQSRMDVSIIYVNWNSVAYIRESIRSVYEHTRGLQFEIIVVDNASPAENVDTLKEEFPEIASIKSATNLGFAGANNLGYKSCSGENILFLNPDTKLVSPAINAMLRHLRSLPDAGIMGCKLLNSDFSTQTSCIQRFPTILNQVLDVDFLRRRWPRNPLWGIGPLYSDSVEPAKVEVVSGACLLIKRAALEKVSLFSEDYFMYAEDLDLCYKVVQAGFANYYTGEGTIIHYGGKSSEPQSATMMKWRAIPRFCDKNRGRFYGSIFRIVMAFTAVGRLAVIKIASAFGNTFAPQTDLNSALAKWRTILSVLLTQSAPS
jgi:N-acetylglucosaminyl-diphospho-decaprenol L-rhamnosyltransferase